MELAVVSDSHVPGRARTVPEPFEARIRAADHVVHAGDFNSLATYETFRELADGLTAVSGNIDPPSMPLPGTVTFERAGVRFVVTHGDGATGGYESDVADVARSEGGDVVIAGHTHAVLDIGVDGVRLLNPGRVTGAAPARRATMMTLFVEDGDVDVTVHELDD